MVKTKKSKENATPIFDDNAYTGPDQCKTCLGSGRVNKKQETNFGTSMVPTICDACFGTGMKDSYMKDVVDTINKQGEEINKQRDEINTQTTAILNLRADFDKMKRQQYRFVHISGKVDGYTCGCNAITDSVFVLCDLHARKLKKELDVNKEDK